MVFIGFTFLMKLHIVFVSTHKEKQKYLNAEYLMCSVTNKELPKENIDKEQRLLQTVRSFYLNKQHFFLAN